jgi:hypothetical protein
LKLSSLAAAVAVALVERGRLAQLALAAAEALADRIHLRGFRHLTLEAQKLSLLVLEAQEALHKQLTLLMATQPAMVVRHLLALNCMHPAAAAAAAEHRQAALLEQLLVEPSLADRALFQLALAEVRLALRQLLS